MGTRFEFLLELAPEFDAPGAKHRALSVIG
jgi:hypothetical protein